MQSVSVCVITHRCTGVTGLTAPWTSLQSFVHDFSYMLCEGKKMESIPPCLLPLSSASLDGRIYLFLLLSLLFPRVSERGLGAHPTYAICCIVSKKNNSQYNKFLNCTFCA